MYCGTSRLGNNVGTGVPDGPKKYRIKQSIVLRITRRTVREAGPYG